MGYFFLAKDREPETKWKGCCFGVSLDLPKKTLNPKTS